MDWWSEIVGRVTPGGPLHVTWQHLLLTGAISLAIIVIDPLWRIARLAVTFVHELGHAVVGILCRRRFTGFVLRGDASGHAVTRGRPRGPGRVLTAWAGYPAPAVVGAVLVAAALRGWAAPVITVALLVALVALVRVRSFLTAVVTLGILAGLAVLWWWRIEAWQGWVLMGSGLISIVGAWRHVGAVARDPSPSSDPGALARLTRVPALVWTASFALVCAAATWFVVMQVRGVWPT
ncbi:MAG TPA: M50 family metallopeptidase [Ruania sp.]|nr:M50 family metallopeptidase [Ruania sp.]